MNYLYGTTGVPFGTYFTASAMGLIPGSFMYVYTGHALRSLSDLLSGDPKSFTLYYQVLALLGITTTVLVFVKLANDARLVGQPPVQDSVMGEVEPANDSEW